VDLAGCGFRTEQWLSRLKQSAVRRLTQAHADQSVLVKVYFEHLPRDLLSDHHPAAITIARQRLRPKSPDVNLLTLGECRVQELQPRDINASRKLQSLHGKRFGN